MQKISTKIKQRYHELVKILQKHDYAYFILNQPTVSDEEYDHLFSQIKKIEKQYPSLILPESPSQRVGGKALDFFEKEEHRTPMLSLQNTWSFGELVDFEKRIKRKIHSQVTSGAYSLFQSPSDSSSEPEVGSQSDLVSYFLNKNPLTYYCEPKLDGLAIELIYEKGILVKALTRGDGQVGENVTSNVKTLRSLPLQLKTFCPPPLLEVRGEIFMLKKDFESLNKNQAQKGLELFSNPRNLVAGSIRQLDPKKASKRPMRVFCYASGWREKNHTVSQKDFVNQICQYGLPVLPLATHYDNISVQNPSYLCSSLNEVKRYYKKIEKLRNSLPFHIDGIVIKVNSFLTQELLGVSSKSPRWAIAFKFQSKKAVTQVKDISVRVGRTGVLTPVAHLKPVFLGGVRVEYASLYNQDEVQRKDIRVGDQVIVHRAGDVIPAVLSVLKDKRPSHSKPYQMVNHCPNCGEKVKKNEGEVDTRCINPLCAAVLRQSLKHFVSKGAMNVNQLGDKIIDTLVETKKVKKFSDLYKLTLEDLCSLDGFGLKSSQQILEALKESLNVELACFIHSWGIPHVGEVTARILAEKFSHLEEMLSQFQREKEDFKEKLLQMTSIGPKTANSLVKFVNKKSFLSEMEELKKLGLKIQNSFYKDLESSEKPQALKGQSIAITGTFPLKREEIKKWIRTLGGHYAASVSSNTHFLLYSEKKGKKFEKATHLGTALISWSQFQEWMSEKKRNSQNLP